MKTAIIGAGIGGLAAALSLHAMGETDIRRYSIHCAPPPPATPR